MALQSQTQRSLLFGFIGSIVCCGLVGIYCLLLGQLGWLEQRILLTTTFVGLASILGLASAVPWERRRWPPIGLAGFVAVTLALALALVAVWVEDSWDWQNYSKLMFVVCVLAFALPHVGLLSLARLRRQYLWTQAGTVGAVGLLAAQMAVSIVLEFDGEAWVRAMGILGILVGCGTIAVPILHRVSTIRRHEEVQTVELNVSLTCPRCEREQTVPVGRSACTGCGLKFSIEIEEEHCRKCGYPLYRLQSAVCPECGTPIADSAVK